MPKKPTATPPQIPPGPPPADWATTAIQPKPAQPKPTKPKR